MFCWGFIRARILKRSSKGQLGISGFYESFKKFCWALLGWVLWALVVRVVVLGFWRLGLLRFSDVDLEFEDCRSVLSFPE